MGVDIGFWMGLVGGFGQCAGDGGGGGGFGGSDAVYGEYCRGEVFAFSGIEWFGWLMMVGFGKALGKVQEVY